MILTVIALSFHVLRFLCAGPLWRDERGALSVARLPWSELLTYFPHEAFPLPFPTVVRGYTTVAGTSEVSLRLFGLGVGIVWLAVLWFNARLLRRCVPLIGMAFVGMSPLFFVWGDTIRGYGLGGVLIVLTFGLFGHSIIRPRPFVFFAAALCAILSVQCLLANAVILFAICLSAAIAQAYQKRVRYALITMGIGVIAATSMLPYLGPYSQGRDWDVVLRTPVQLGSLVSGFIDALGNPNKTVLRVWAVAFLATVAGAIWVLQNGPIKEVKDKAVVIFALLVGLVTPLCYCVYLQILSYETQDWYYLALIAILIVSMDSIIGIAARHFMWMRITQLLVAVSVIALSALPDLAIARTRMTNLDLISAELKHRAAPKDLILLLPWSLGISFRHYYEGTTPWETAPRLEDFRMHRYDLLKQRMTLTNPLDEVIKHATDTLRSGHRLWIVSEEDFALPQQIPMQPAPAPHDSIEWSARAYQFAWMNQVEYFVQKHARHCAVTSEEMPGINQFENARLAVVEGWRDDLPSHTYEEMFAKSDLVVLARPVASHDSGEREFDRNVTPPVPVAGVVTECDALYVLKGPQIKQFDLHHFRDAGRREPNLVLIDVPTGIAFDLPKHRRYLMFLLREADGRFAPVSGQTDVEDISVQELEGSSAD